MKWRLGALVAVTMAASSILGPPTASRADGSDHRCGIGKGGRALVDEGGSCMDPAPPDRRQVAIAIAKTEAANAHALAKQSSTGLGAGARLQAAEQRLAALTGEAIRPVRTGANRAGSLAVGDRAPSTVGDGVGIMTPLSEWYWPFQQINSYYCGPATAQSVLFYLTPRVSAVVDPVTGVHDTLTGTRSHDQPILANSYWLATDQYSGTNWGNAYMPFTLNTWRGTNWYVQAATPAYGGSLTQGQALVDIQYDVDRYYPIVENVRYGSTTYRPPGFAGNDYFHWDTIYGYFWSGEQYVQIGQVYGDTDQTYTRYYNQPWNLHWDAIGGWHGIVW